MELLCKMKTALFGLEFYQELSTMLKESPIAKLHSRSGQQHRPVLMKLCLGPLYSGILHVCLNKFL